MNENNNNKHDWITTYTGKRFFPLSPKIEDVDIVDIIHALSNQSRFLGHCTEFYSIAQHCVLVSEMCSMKNALYALLHDASEAYLSDVPSPLKHLPAFSHYKEIEENVMNVICDAFGLDRTQPEEVHVVDKRMLATESRDLTTSQGMGWNIVHKPFDFVIRPWTPSQARIKFLSRLHELTLMKAKEVI